MKKEKIIENIKSLSIAIIIALIIRAFLVQSFHIPSGSMIPTLLIHDFIIVDKVTYHFRKPNRGDVVVFHFPLNEDIYYIKRIIGIPGDKVQVKNGVLYINDKPVKLTKENLYTYSEKHTKKYGQIYKEFLPVNSSEEKTHLILKATDGNNRGDDTDVFIVPQEKYFMMGDNRNSSYDSRYWGFVDKSEMVGIARVIFFSWNSEKHLPRISRIGKLIN